MIGFGIHINRDGTAQDHRIDDAAVNIPGQNNLLPFFTGRQHHRLNRRSRAVDHKKGLLSAKGIGCQFLGFFDHRNRMAEIIQRLHRIDVQGHTALP